MLPAALPAPLSATLSLALSVYLRECGAAGSVSGQTACPFRRQSGSRHGHASPLRPGAHLRPSYRVWKYVSFLSTCCQTSLPFDFLSVLIVRRGAVCLPTPPSWFSPRVYSLIQQIFQCPSVPRTGLGTETLKMNKTDKVPTCTWERETMAKSGSGSCYKEK